MKNIVKSQFYQIVREKILWYMFVVALFMQILMFMLPLWLDNEEATSAGEFFNLETTAITMLLRFSYYIRSFEPEWILTLTDTVNRNSIRVCGIPIPDGCGLLRSISAESASADSKDVIQVNIELEINPSGFRRSVPDKGYYCMSQGLFSRICVGIAKHSGLVTYGPMEKMVQIRKENAPLLPTEDPVWLDGSGNLFPLQSMPSKPPMRTFLEKRSTDWGVLSLPSGNPW